MANLGGTPPQACVGASWGDYLLLANGTFGGTYFAKRLWWSDVGNAASWTVAALAAGSFWDFPDEIIAVAPLRSGILVFGYRDSWLLAGDVPPPGGNMARKDFAVGNGCVDARSVARYKDSVIWANTNGIYKSDGAYPVNVTAQAGVSSWWHNEMKGYYRSWTVAAEVFYGKYIISLSKSSGARTTLVIDLETFVAYQFSGNVRANMYATRKAGPGVSSTVFGEEELFSAHLSQPYALKWSTVWNPPDPTDATYGDQAYKDAVDDYITGFIDTRFYRLKTTGLKRVRNIYLTYALENAISKGQVDGWIQAYYTERPESGVIKGGLGLITLPQTLPSVTGTVRKPIRVGRRVQGLGFGIQIVNPSLAARFYMLEADAFPIEESR